MKRVIGRTDVVDFPKLALLGIDVKIDSGAYTSSFHCHNVKLEDGKLKCQFLDPGHDKYHERFVVFEQFSEKLIKSSNGISEMRYLVKTDILIFEKSYKIELTLTERGSMQFPVLLGRKFLSPKFIIDPARKNLSARKIYLKYKLI